MELNEKGLPFFPELRFEDKRHIYTLGGQLLPSVTTVMKPLDEGQRSGRVYKKPYSRATYTASAPGEPPARRSGALRLNWHGEVKGGNIGSGGTQIVAALESEQHYAGYLENGTSKMAPRPYKDCIIEKATPEIVAIYNEPYS